MHDKYKLYLPIKKKLLDFATMSNDKKLLKKKSVCYHLTSEISSRMTLMHSTTRSGLPPTSTTRSVEWGQHSWKSLIVVWVFLKKQQQKNVFHCQGNAFFFFFFCEADLNIKPPGY